jgi:hypothetical protein
MQEEDRTGHYPLPIMKSRQVHRLTKIKLYETIMRSVTWYVNEAWTLSQTTEKNV